MNTFKVKIEIEAESQEEAAEVLDSLMYIHENFKNNELIAFTDIMADNPEMIKMIKSKIEKPPKILMTFTKSTIGKKILGVFGVNLEEMKKKYEKN